MAQDTTPRPFIAGAPVARAAATEVRAGGGQVTGQNEPVTDEGEPDAIRSLTDSDDGFEFPAAADVGRVTGSPKSTDGHHHD